MEYTVTTQPITKNLFIIEHQLTNLSFINNFKTLIDKNVGPLNYKTNVNGQIFNSFNFRAMTLSQAWGNIIEKGDEVMMHNHRYNSVSGVLYLTENGPGTYFPQFNKTIVEKIGKFVFFSAEADHGVAKSNVKQKRYTIACNFIEIDNY